MTEKKEGMAIGFITDEALADMRSKIGLDLRRCVTIRRPLSILSGISASASGRESPFHRRVLCRPVALRRDHRAAHVPL